VDEGQMYETFQTFGSLVEQPKVCRVSIMVS